MTEAQRLHLAKFKRNGGVTRERAHVHITRNLPLIEVTELPRATLAEREILLDLGIIDSTGALNNEY